MVDESRNIYNSRMVDWGHWGITFMNPQPDETKNFGIIIGTLYFHVVNGCGPQDGLMGSVTRKHYKDVCNKWIIDGVLPNNDEYYTPYSK